MDTDLELLVFAVDARVKHRISELGGAPPSQVPRDEEIDRKRVAQDIKAAMRALAQRRKS